MYYTMSLVKYDIYLKLLLFNNNYSKCLLNFHISLLTIISYTFNIISDTFDIT